MNFLNRSLIKKVFSNHVLKLLFKGINFFMIALYNLGIANSDTGEFTAVYAAIVLVSRFYFLGISGWIYSTGKKFQPEYLPNSIAV